MKEIVIHDSKQLKWLVLFKTLEDFYKNLELEIVIGIKNGLSICDFSRSDTKTGLSELLK